MTDDRIPSPTEVADLFDPDALRRICVADDFTPYGFTRTTLEPHPHGGERFYWYRDGGPDVTVLAVAHLDTVQDDRTCQITETASGLLGDEAQNVGTAAQREGHDHDERGTQQCGGDDPQPSPQRDDRGRDQGRWPHLDPRCDGEHHGCDNRRARYQQNAAPWSRIQTRRF